MTRYFKTLVAALVAALMATAGDLRDANAGDGAAPEARAESVESLFHLATDDSSQCTLRCTGRALRCGDRCNEQLSASDSDDAYDAHSRCKQRCDERQEECEDRCYGREPVR